MNNSSPASKIGNGLTTTLIESVLTQPEAFHTSANHFSFSAGIISNEPSAFRNSISFIIVPVNRIEGYINS